MSSDGNRLRIGIIGCGHWGPNHLRVFSELNRSMVTAVADVNRQRLDWVQRRYGHVAVNTDYHELLDNPNVDAVVISTPTVTHAKIAREALQAGKHVLVEKPLCKTVEEGRDLPGLALDRGLTIMVGHVFVYNNGITRLRDSILAGELGRVQYLDAVRTNLGPVRGDVNALYDLGTHDISIFNYLLSLCPVEVSALGRCISQRDIEDVCFATLRYADGTLGHIHVSWMNPRKVRTVTVIGQRKMADWDDVDPVNTLRVYDKGVDEPPHYNSFGEFQCLLRSSDVYLPKVDRVEPLINQGNAFLNTVLDGSPCRSGAKEALDVVAVLEAASKSMHDGGKYYQVERLSVEEGGKSKDSGRLKPQKSATRPRVLVNT